MSGEEQPFVEEIDAAHCPLCGRDAVDWDSELCEHLIADFGDGSSGDEGILCGPGGSRSGNAALDCLQPLYGSILEFAQLALPADELEDGLNDKDRSRVLRILRPEEAVPSWLTTVLKDLSYGEAPNHRTVEEIWREAVPWTEALILTYSVIGTMTASSVKFVWSRVPAEGAKQIADAVERVTSEVKSAIGRLAAME